ncbi:serine hydrolase [Streptomyces sp. NBC_00199]|nr:serine hydrolase [Streptomyces sp. NBC_00199]
MTSLVARRTTGKSTRQLLRERVTLPLGIDGDPHFRVPSTELHRLARLEDAVRRPATAPDDAIRAPWEVQPSAAVGNSHQILQADIPSVGTFTARGAAAVNAAALSRPDVRGAGALSDIGRCPGPRGSSRRGGLGTA